MGSDAWGLAGVFSGAFLASLGFSCLLTWRLITWAPKWGLVDVPSGRKNHAKPTPMGGGIAIFVGVLAPLMLVLLAAFLFPAVNPSTLADDSWARSLFSVVAAHAPGIRTLAPTLALLMGASAIQMVVGLADDYRRSGLGYRLRLAIEVGLVSVLIAQGIRLSLFTDSIWVSAPITVLWIVGLTNALNFLDNMDGLSAGVALWASVFFFVISVLLGNHFIAGGFATLIGALLGFLAFNWPPARIFMGDAGSNFVGFWLGLLTVVATYHTEGFSHVTVLAPVCILAVPIYDSASVIVLRIKQGKSPFQADRQHLSHRLVDLGFKPKGAVLAIHLLTITTGLSGLLLYFVPPGASALVLLQVGCLLGLIALLETAGRRRARRQAAMEPAPAPATSLRPEEVEMSSNP